MLISWVRSPDWRAALVRRIDLAEAAADIAANLGTTADLRVTPWSCYVRVGAVSSTAYNFDGPIRAVIWSLTLLCPFLALAAGAAVGGRFPGLVVFALVLGGCGLTVQVLHNQLEGLFDSRVTARLGQVRESTFTFEEVAVHALLLLWAIRDARPFGAGRLHPGQFNWTAQGNSVNASVGVPVRKALRQLAENPEIARRVRSGQHRIGWAENSLLDQPFTLAGKYTEGMKTAWKRPTALPNALCRLATSKVAVNVLWTMGLLFGVVYVLPILWPMVEGILRRWN